MHAGACALRHGSARTARLLRHAGPLRARTVPPPTPRVLGSLASTATTREETMPQTKADRSAAGKKAAATRARNKQKAQSETAGKKAAATRQGRSAGAAVGE